MLTDRQKDALERVLKIELGKPEYTGKTPEVIYAILTTPTSSQEQISKIKSITDLDFLSVLGTETITKLAHWVNFPDFRNKIKAQDFEGVNFWRQMMQAAGLLTADESSALLAKLSEKVTVDGATVTNPPPIHNLLSGTNLRAVLGKDFIEYDKEHGRIVEVPITMPNTISLDDLAEVIVKL